MRGLSDARMSAVYTDRHPGVGLAQDEGGDSLTEGVEWAVELGLRSSPQPAWFPGTVLLWTRNSG